MDQTGQFARDDDGGVETPLNVGNDERRMHVRAYNYWVSLLAGRDYPSIEDLDPAGIEDFAPNSVLLDFTCGADQATFAYLGAALRAEGEIGNDVRSIADVPRRSVLSRLTEHYLEIIANRAPIGFEAEYVNQRGLATMYRGILMPFTSDGDTIDFIYGVINWKEVSVEVEMDDDIRAAVTAALEEEIIPSFPSPQGLGRWSQWPASPVSTKSKPREIRRALRDRDSRRCPALRQPCCRAPICRGHGKRVTSAAMPLPHQALGEAYDFALAVRTGSWETPMPRILDDCRTEDRGSSARR